MTQTDLEVFERAAGGDAGALGALCDAFGPQMLGLAYAITLDHAAAETSVVDAFVELVERRDEVVLRASALPAALRVRGVLATTLTEIVRRRSLRSASAKGMREDDAGAVSGVLLVPAELGEEAREAHRALGRLSPDERRTFETAYFRGLGVTAVAARLGLDEASAREHLAAALRELTLAQARLAGALEARVAKTG